MSASTRESTSQKRQLSGDGGPGLRPEEKRLKKATSPEPSSPVPMSTTNAPATSLSTPKLPAVSMSVLGGAQGCTVNNPVFNNVAGDYTPTFLNIDGGGFSC